jgi:elongation factor Tu
MYVLTKDEGGRHTPFVENYKPQLYARTMDVACTLTWPENEQGQKNRNEGKMVMPGDNVELKFDLPFAMAVNEGLRFTVREGGKTVGTGILLSFYDLRCRHSNFRVIPNLINAILPFQMMQEGKLMRG